MKTIVVANPKAAGGKVGSAWRKFERPIHDIFGLADVSNTTCAGDATRLVREAVDAGFERIVVVGGDGTINEAVNGLFAEGADKGADVSLAIYPAGTGGDFVRSLGLANGDVQELLEDASDRWIDAGRATYTKPDGGEGVRYFANISSFGSTGLIVDRVNKASKRLGGKMSFYLGTVKGMAAYRNQRVTLRIDDEHEEETVINMVAVANGRFFGGSMMVAPNAMVDDGMFDVIVVGDVGLATFLANSKRMYKGNHLELPDIRQLRGRKVTATALGKQPVLIDLDGEQPGQLPVSYELLPKAIKVFAPWDGGSAAVR